MPLHVVRPITLKSFALPPSQVFWLRCCQRSHQNALSRSRSHRRHSGSRSPRRSGSPAATGERGTCCYLLLPAATSLILAQQAAPGLGRRRRRKRTRSTRRTRRTRRPGQRSEVKPLAWRSLPLMLATLVGAAPRVRSLITYG